MTIGSSAIGSTPISASPDQKVIEAVYESEILPSDAKHAIKDYVEATFQKTWNTIEEFIANEPPPELMEYWDSVKELLQQLINNVHL